MNSLYETFMDWLRGYRLKTAVATLRKRSEPEPWPYDEHNRCYAVGSEDSDGHKRFYPMELTWWVPMYLYEPEGEEPVSFDSANEAQRWLDTYIIRVKAGEIEPHYMPTGVEDGEAELDTTD